MFRAEVNKSRNLLKISYSRRVGPEETKRCAEEIRLLSADLTPGFRLLTNLTGLETMDLACVPHIKGIMDLLNKKGVELVVRVIPDPGKDIGLNILSLFHYRRGVQIVTFEKLEEAMKVLAG